MNVMRKLIAWFAGEGWCPSCESELMEDEAGYHHCKSETCSVVVDYRKGGWRYGGESELRRLPGVAGMAFGKRRAA